VILSRQFTQSALCEGPQPFSPLRLSDASFASRTLLRDDFVSSVFSGLHTLPSSVSPKSFACHSYKNCRVYTNNSHSGSPRAFAAKGTRSPAGPRSSPRGFYSFGSVDGVYPGLVGAFSVASATFSLHGSRVTDHRSLSRNSFRRNTYGLPRKCCKQTTYGKVKSFRCNTYRNHGGRGRCFHRALRAARSGGTVHRYEVAGVQSIVEECRHA
jgi:hypothetical protein